MKQIIPIFFLLFILNNQAKSQNVITNRKDTLDAYSLYKLNDNDYQVTYDNRGLYELNEHRERKNRFGKTLMYTGVLVGGLMLADEASRHDYFINNTMVYGVGGILTILSTGLVISSLNEIYKQ